MSVSGAGGPSYQQIYGLRNKGIGGLATGLDTDSLVEALTAGTRAKIQKQNQDRQILNWKMTAYRGVAASLKAFQDKYLSYSSSGTNNIMSPAFFNTMKATSSSDKVSLRADSNSLIGDFTIDRIQQLATAEKLTGQNSLSTKLESAVSIDALMNNGDADFTGKTLRLDSNGDVRTIKLDSLNGIDDKDAFLQELQTLIDKAYGTKNVWHDERYDEHDNLIVDDEGNPIGGFVAESIVTVSEGTNGSLRIDAPTSQVYVASDADHLGLSEGQSNRVRLSTKIGDIEAFQNLKGEVFTFEINGVSISVNKNDTLSTLKSRIDNSTAGVRFDYNSFTDEFTLVSKSTGAGENIVMRDTSGDLMHTLFGVQSGNSVTSSWLTMEEWGGSNNTVNIGNMSLNDRRELVRNLSDMEFSLTINGVTRTVTADRSAIDQKLLDTNSIQTQHVLDAINKGIQNAFGTNSANVGFAQQSDGTIKLGILEPARIPDPAFPGSNLTIANPNKNNLVPGSTDVAFLATTSTTSASRNAMALLGFTSYDVEAFGTGNMSMHLGISNVVSGADSHSLPTISGNAQGVFDVTVNGVTKQLSIADVKASTTDKQLQDKLNDALKNAFGSDFEKNTASFKVEDGRVSLSTYSFNTAVQISRSPAAELNNKTDIFNALGFTGDAVNNASIGGASGVTLGQFRGGDTLGGGTLTINGKAFDYDADTRLQDLINNINNELGYGFASFVNGQISFSDKSGSIEIEDDGRFLNQFFGIKADGDGITRFETQPQADNFNENRTAGTNAEIVVDGRVIASASNTFNINGVSITAEAVSAAGDAPIKISVKSDSNEVVDKLKSWIEDYNALVKTLRDMVNEDVNRAYAPLTDEQKAMMTQDQIKNWEDEAKKGILRNDSTLRSILSQMQGQLYQRVESAGIALYDLGITTKREAESGQIELTAKGEEQLRKMLESEPDRVRLFFTDPADGMAARLNTIIENASRTSSVNRGTLIRLAGTDIQTGDNTSTLGNKIDSIDKYITTLRARLEKEYNNYWARFSALETSIQRLNTQSGWLQQWGQ
ncbi:MAG: flagellar filament capping protein FliD [Oscillospiraceae bacterium]|nr:flagellar filament capping protein FliD [Oscillospiraceae bacterium]